MRAGWGLVLVTVAGCLSSPLDRTAMDGGGRDGGGVDGSGGDGGGGNGDGGGNGTPDAAPSGGRIAVSLNNAFGGAGDLADFPVAIPLTAADYVSLGLAAGLVPQVVDASATALAYELSAPDGNGTRQLWVKVPLVAAQSAGVSFYVCGTANPATTSSTDVWTSYAAVWHLGEDPGTAGTFRDSTANHLDATLAGSATQVAGQVGPGLHLAGTAVLTVASPHVALDLKANVTVEATVTVDTVMATTRSILAAPFYELRASSQAAMGVPTMVGNFATGLVESPAVDGLTTSLVHLLGSYRSSNGFLELYRGGVLVGHVDVANGEVLAGVAANAVQLGRALDGTLSEVRVSSTVRSAAYAAAASRVAHGDFATQSFEAAACP